MNLLEAAIFGYSLGLISSFMAYLAWLAAVALLANNRLPLALIRCRVLRWLTKGEWLVVEHRSRRDVFRMHNNLLCIGKEPYVVR